MPKTTTVRVVPHDDPHCLLVLWSDGHSAIVGRDEAAQLATELLRHVPPARAAAVAREVLARPEVQRAEGELTTARLLADLEGEGGAGAVDGLPVDAGAAATVLVRAGVDAVDHGARPLSSW